MRVAVFAALDLRVTGGIENLLGHLLPRYAARGLDYALFVPSRLRAAAAARLDEVRSFWPLTATAGARFPRLMAPYTWAQLALLLGRRFDVVHVHAAYPLGVAFARALTTLPVGTVLHCHAYDVQVQPEVGYGVRLDPRIDRAVARSVPAYDALIVANRNIRDIVLAMGAEPGRTRRVPSGVDLERFRGPIDRVALRRELGVEDDTPLLVSAGRNVPVKGYRFALEALALVAARGRAFRYAILGRDASALHTDVSRLGLERAVLLDERIRGPVLADYLRSADAYLLPSLLEGFPLTKSEAMAAGLPVVTTPVPGCADYTRHGVNGLTAAARTVEAYAEVLERILADPVERAALGARARADAAALDWERILDAYVESYRAALARRR